MKFLRPYLLLILISLFSSVAAFSQSTGSLAGTVTDTFGALVPGTTVIAVSADGDRKQTLTNSRGEYSISGLVAGRYTVQAIAPKLAPYENAEISIVAAAPLNVVKPPPTTT